MFGSEGLGDRAGVTAGDSERGKRRFCPSQASRSLPNTYFISSLPPFLHPLPPPAAPRTGHAMKPIHPRIYAALPRPVAPIAAATSSTSRVRSNSASRSLYTGSLSFFDSPPQPLPSSRPANPNLVVSSRLAAEVKAEYEGHAESPYTTEIGPPQSQTHGTGPPPYSLALTSGQSEFSHSSAHIKPLFPYSSFPPAFAYNPAHSADIRSSEPAAKRQRTRYHLDVGAYGIPKRSHGTSIAGRDGHGRLAFDEAFAPSDRAGSLGRAVQVGEDAYFVRDNAMGVADGVGGWSKNRRPGEFVPQDSGGMRGSSVAITHIGCVDWTSTPQCSSMSLDMRCLCRSVPSSVQVLLGGPALRRASGLARADLPDASCASE